MAQRMRRAPLNPPGTDRARPQQARAGFMGRNNMAKMRTPNAGQKLQAVYRNRSTEQAGANRAAPKLNSFQPMRKQQMQKQAVGGATGGKLQQTYQTLASQQLAPRSE